MKRYYRYVDDVNTGRVLACLAITLALGAGAVWAARTRVEAASNMSPSLA